MYQEFVEHGKRGTSFGLIRCRRKPPHSKKLSIMVDGLLAAAEIDRNLVNVIIVDDHKTFVSRPRGIARLLRGVTDLYSHTHAL
jgi:hypothetical protein